MNNADPQRHLDTTDLDADIGAHTLRGGALTAVAQVVKSILDIASTLVLARLLAPQDFGLIGMVIAVTGFIGLFKDLGLSMATIQRAKISHAQVSTLFWVNVGLSATIMVLTMAVAPAVAWFYEDPRLLWITVILAGGFIFGGLTVQHDAILRRRMRFGAVAIAEVVALAGSLAVAVWMAFEGWGVWALVARHVTGAVLQAVAVWVLCGWRPSKPGNFDDVKGLLAFGGNLTGFSIVNYFSRNLDDILIGRVHGAAPLGFYQKAYEILMVPIKQINNPVSAVAIPALSRLVDDPERYRAAYLRIVDKVLLLTMALAAWLTATADWVVYLALGPQWGESAQIFAVLGMLIFIQPLGNATGWLFVTQNRTGEMLRWGLIGAAFSVASFVIGLPWGAMGVAAAYAVSGLVVRMPFLMWYVGRRGPVGTSDLYRSLGPFAAAGVVTFLVLVFGRSLVPTLHPALGLVSSGGVTLVTMAAVLAMFRRGREAMKDVAVIGRRLVVKKAKGA